MIMISILHIAVGRCFRPLGVTLLTALTSVVLDQALVRGDQS